MSWSAAISLALFQPCTLRLRRSHTGYRGGPLLCNAGNHLKAAAGAGNLALDCLWLVGVAIDKSARKENPDS